MPLRHLVLPVCKSTADSDRVRQLQNKCDAKKWTLTRGSEGQGVTRIRCFVDCFPHEVAALGIRRTFQNLELFREASVHENVALGLAYRYRAPLVSEFLDLPLSRAQRHAAAEEAGRILDTCGLSAVADAIVSELPYGVQKTVELARALAGHPKLLLLDEPAAGMNPEESRRVADAARRLRDQDGITILLIEHDMRVVMAVCDHIVVLDHGEVIAKGLPSEIRRSPAVIKAYLGEEAAHA